MFFEALETGIGLDIILWLQDIRTPFLALLAEILDVAGEEFAYIALLAAIYWLVDRSLGKRMVFALAIITLLTIFFKDLLARPRPFEVSDMVMPLFDETSNGIPSGHTGITAMVWGLIALWYRRTWVTVFAIVYILMQGVFRMVAGVHFPQDVVGGLLLAGITLAIYYPLSQQVTEALRDARSERIYGGILLMTIAAFGLFFVAIPAEARSEYLSMLGLLAGGGIGAVYEARRVYFDRHESLWRRGAQFAIGLVAAVALLLGLDTLFAVVAADGTLVGDLLRVLRYAAVTMFAIAIWPEISIGIGLASRTHNKSMTRA